MPVVRDRDAEIALFQYKAGSAVALTAEHDADRAVPEVHLIVVLAADFGSVGICGDFARSLRASSACASDATTTQT